MPKESESQSMSGVLYFVCEFFGGGKEKEVLRSRSPLFCFRSSIASQKKTLALSNCYLKPLSFCPLFLCGPRARPRDRFYPIPEKWECKNKERKRETNLETSTAAAAAAAVDDDEAELLLLDRGCARAAALGRSTGLEKMLIL